MLTFVTSLLLAVFRRLKPGGVIINGHTLTPGQTCTHLDALGRWFDFIGVEELPHRVRHPARRPFCLLTFDDGKRSNFTAMAPELERRGIPAAFYVTTDPVSQGSVFWFDQRNELVRRLGYCPAGLELAALKQLPFAQLTERLDRATARYGPTLANAPDDLRPMSWEEVRSLAQRGFIIGAHGRTHAILTRESHERACAEIEESLSKVSAELGNPCRTFAFPNGNYTPALARHACQCGATTVMTTEPMWVDGRSSLWRLPRIQLFGGFTRGRIELKLTLAALRGVLANPDGSGRAYRHLHRPERGWRENPVTR